MHLVVLFSVISKVKGTQFFLSHAKQILARLICILRYTYTIVTNTTYIWKNEYLKSYFSYQGGFLTQNQLEELSYVMYHMCVHV